MKKILSSICLSFLLCTSLSAQSYPDSELRKTLFKHIEGGQHLSKYYDQLELETISCKELNIPLAAVSKCYLTQDIVTIGNKDTFTLSLSTINNKINSIHLIQDYSTYPAHKSFWNKLYRSGLKSYAIFNKNITFPASATLMDKNLFKYKHNIELVLLNKKEEVKLTSLFVQTSLKGKIDLKKTLRKEVRKIKRTYEVSEIYEPNSQAWSLKVDIKNPLNELLLFQEYKGKFEK